uniref:Putative conserved secreted protein n=1 Tax=Amblyomma tuberculatum TaxID=48802 RepID=A0A6M2E153_9ACAR
MHFQAVLLVATAIVFVANWPLSAGYIAINKVPVINGKCQYNGTEIAPGEPLQAEFPCAEWRCGTDGTLSIAGCGLAEAGPGCVVVKGTGVYPSCCGQISCD